MSPIRRKRSEQPQPVQDEPRKRMPEGYAQEVAAREQARRSAAIEQLKAEKPWLEGVSPDGLSYKEAVAIVDGDERNVQIAFLYAQEHGSGELLLKTGAKLFFQRDGDTVSISLFGYAQDGSDLEPYSDYLPDTAQAA